MGKEIQKLFQILKKKLKINNHKQNCKRNKNLLPIENKEKMNRKKNYLLKVKLKKKNQKEK